LPSGRLPAPPHDESGHTWHHADDVLFAITKNGLVPPNAPNGYESDMPAFGEKLRDDEIRAVLAYIETHWKSRDIVSARQQITRNARRQ
jgi:mono/diheme cytochrome c family protein